MANPSNREHIYGGEWLLCYNKSHGPTIARFVLIALIKKHMYWQKHVPEGYIDQHRIAKALVTTKTCIQAFDTL
jgi:hypothetical protein